LIRANPSGHFYFAGDRPLLLGFDIRLFGIEFALDLMYWPTKHLGLWLQPSYGIVARGPGGSHELSSTAGIIVGW